MQRPRAALCTAFSFAVLALFAPAQDAVEDTEPVPPRGLRRHEPGAFEGYTLFVPNDTARLIDMEGRVVHEWTVEMAAGTYYLKDNGNLLGAGELPDPPGPFQGGGQGGFLHEIDWDGNVVWEYRFSSEEFLQHHDIAPTSYGTILVIAWELKSAAEARDVGRHPQMLTQRQMWPDFIAEIEPIGADDAEVIWEWHVWDHLIQELDPDLPDHGNPGEHPERVDINADGAEMSEEQFEQMKALGYIGAGGAASFGADWLHTNSIDYNEELDQILLSVPRLNEIWIIDHSTTMDEAASREGGNSGMGGDLLYRWGHPMNYRRGFAVDQRLVFQHDARWIEPGLPGAGNVTVFNNSSGVDENGVARSHSSVLELELPLNDGGTYDRPEGLAYGPEEPVWEYQAPGFFSSFISGAHRLPNGNTLICEGASGRILEVTAAGQVVWEYLNPFANEIGEAEFPPYGLFRATRIAPDHPGLQGRDLRPITGENR